MKKHILIYALSALTVFGLGSCVKPVEETLPTGDGARTVTFTAELGGQTRTGLQMKFIPNWVNTDLANVHLFETVGGLTDEGDNVTMTIEEGTNNEVAHFTAQFGTETELFVTPPTRADGDAAYTAIVASRADGKYVVPATQTPDPVSLFDPNADFLVASGALVEETGTGKQVDLTFLRPVAVSRLAIMNIEGQSIKSVKITSTDKLTGAVAYEGIDFAAGTASFDAETGSEELTLSYGDGIAVDATSTFYAYFISLPGSKNITAVEVTTNRYVYTKTFGTGKTLTFNTTEFKNIAVDMSKVTPEVVIAPHHYEKVTASSGIVSGESYLVVWENGTSAKVFKPILTSDQTQFVENDPSNAIDATLYPGNWIPSSTAVDACQIIISDIKGDAATSHKYAIGVPSTDGYYFHPRLQGDNARNFGADKAPMDYRSETTVVDGVLNMVCQNYYLLYSPATAAFLASNSVGDNVKPALYKYVEGPDPAPAAQTLSFSPTSVTGTAGRTVTPPTLSGAQTTVTYSSDTPAVATVNATTGALTLIAEGTATITATAAAENGYASATASYTVTVNAAPPVTPHYYQKVTSLDDIVSGGKYIVVYENGASSKVFLPVLDETTEGDSLKFKEGDPANAVDAAVYAGAFVYRSDAVDDCQFELMTWEFDSANNRIKANMNSVSTGYCFHPRVGTLDGKVTVARSFAADHWTADFRTYFSFTNDVLNMVCQSYNLLYSTSNQAFLASTTVGDNVKPALYKYVEGADRPATSGTYVKVNSTSELPTNTTDPSGNYLFVYEDGDVAYVFKPICDTAPTGAGNQGSGHTELTKTGSALLVPLTSGGIAAFDAVTACKVKLKYNKNTAYYIQFDAVNDYWLRINTSEMALVAMTSSGYGPSFNFSGSGNNLTLVRTDSGVGTAYMHFNTTTTCFEATATESKVSLYKLSE